MEQEQLSLDLNDSKQQALSFFKILDQKCIYSSARVYLFEITPSSEFMCLGTRIHDAFTTDYTYDYMITIEDACWLYRNNLSIGTHSKRFLKYVKEHKDE